jgi:glycosyltransferase involved in cell wall biosynthesis
MPSIKGNRMDTISFQNDEVPSRILMLVPHEPELDPRIKWVTQLCQQIGRTDIIGYVNEPDKKPSREFDGQIYTERITLVEYPSNTLKPFVIHIVKLIINPRQVLTNVFRKLKHWTFLLLSPYPLGMKLINQLKNAVNLIYRKPINQLENSSIPLGQSRPLLAQTASLQQSIKASALDTKCSSTNVTADLKILDVINHILDVILTQDMIAGALFQRARSVSIQPEVIICHDIYALEAAIKFKQLFGTPVIYDSHEFWPEADLRAANLQIMMMKSFERKLIRQADVVITVSPQIARLLEKLYKIKNVRSVPNAEPNIDHSINRNCEITYPIRFLLQGQASPGRGIEEFLESWSQLRDKRAILILRCPENPFLDCLQRRFRGMISNGQIIFVPPVRETELINVASQADVGVIPYGGTTLNHIYACPNKLSQYMQAGLAILHNADQVFVSEIIQSHECGLSYVDSDPSTLVDAVERLINNKQELRDMQQNSINTAKSEFNWEFQSKSYLEAIKGFYQR